MAGAGRNKRSVPRRVILTVWSFGGDAGMVVVALSFSGFSTKYKQGYRETMDHYMGRKKSLLGVSSSPPVHVHISK